LPRRRHPARCRRRESACTRRARGAGWSRTYLRALGGRRERRPARSRAPPGRAGARTGAARVWLARGADPPAHPTRRLLAGRLPPTMYALNFSSPLVADQLRSGRKSATIRLGDKSGKYKKGMVVRVLCGVRFSPREHVFDAVIDKVEVKTLGDLSPREIEH